MPTILRTALALLLAMLLGPAAAHATMPGAPGLWVDGGPTIKLDDPTDDAPALTLTLPSGSSGAQYPQFSPKGTRVVAQDLFDKRVLYADVAGGGQVKVGFDFPSHQLSDYLARESVFKDERVVYTNVFRVNAGDGINQIWRIDVVAGTAAKVLDIPGSKTWNLSQPRLSPDGTRIAYQRVVSADTGGAIARDAITVDLNSGAVTVVPHSQVALDDYVSPYFDWRPDGNGYLIASGSATAGKMSIYDGANTLIEQASGPGFDKARFTPDGGHTWRPDGCIADKCGLVVRRIPDPGAEVAPDEPLERLVEGVARATDLQPQQQPVIFIHGFAGAKLGCDSDTWLPSTFSAGEDLLEMRLAPDGVSNADHTCGVHPRGLLESAFGVIDIYGKTRDWIEQLAGDRAHEYVWDWRKEPREAVDGLDAMITELLAEPDMVAAGVRKVAIVAHSMGGLVTRAYIDDDARAKRVARAVTVGTPYWGAPKAIFPLAFGIELPEGGDMDKMLPDPQFREFARTISGLYALFPSSHYPPWLTVAGKSLTGDDLQSYLTDLGANLAAVLRGSAAHDQVLDGFERHGVDYRVLLGTGKTTITGVDMNGADVVVHYGDGDGTVPAVSAAQGTDRSDPLGDNVTLMTVCRIGHMEQTAKPAVQRPIEQFLLTGAPPRRTQASNCTMKGFEIRYRGLSTPAAPARLADGDGVALDDVAPLGLGTVLELPGQTLVVTDDAAPVDIAVHGSVEDLTVTPIGADGQLGESVSYGALDGDISVKTGDGAVAVSEGGAEQTPEPGGGDSGGGGAGAGDGDSAAGAGGAGAGAGAAGAGAGAARLALGPLPRRGLTVRHGHIAVAVRCVGTDQCSGRVGIAPARGVAVKIAAGRSKSVRLKVPARAKIVRIRLQSAGATVTSKPVRLRR